MDDSKEMIASSLRRFLVFSPFAVVKISHEGSLYFGIITFSLEKCNLHFCFCKNSITCRNFVLKS